MEINIEKLTDTLSSALLSLELLGEETDSLNIFEGYIDFTFRSIYSARAVYEHFSFIHSFSCDYDESRNSYLVRVFY